MYSIKYLARRVLVYLLTIFIAIGVNFVVPRLIPGNPVEAKMQELYRMGVQMGGSDFVARFSRFFALDQPIYMQFIIYIDGLLHGKMGFSIAYFPMTVEDILVRSLPWTIGLLGVCVVMGFAAGILLGAFLGWSKREGKGSRWMGTAFGVFLVLSHLPYYIVGIMLVYAFTFLVPLFPYGGGVDAWLQFGSIDYIVNIVKHATLPALSIVLVLVGGFALEARGLMVNVLGEDYLFLAKAKGLKEKYIFRQYALKNTIIPTTTDLAISLGTVASGSIMTEIVFSYPGVGSLLFNAVKQLDYPLIQGVVLLIVLGVTTAALLIELVYPLLDPRIGEK